MTTRSHLVLLIVLGSLSPKVQAQGDACGTATVITCGAVISGNTGAPYTADVAPFCGTGDGTGGGVWFRFAGTGSSVTASLCGSAFDTKLRVFSGSCTALACTGGNDDFCGLQSQVTWVSALSTTYDILVHGFGAATGAYTLTLTCAAAPVPMCYSMTTTPYLADPYTGTALTLTDDVHSPAVPIGFPFCYNGTSYTQCVISSNNYVTFNLAMAGTYSPWVTVAVPSNTLLEVSNSILNPWQDIHPGVGGSVMYQTLGTAPNRRFVISYLNVPMFSCTSQLYTSQTVLYEGSNCIGSYITTKPICTTWNSGNAVHALHNGGGTSASVVAGRNNTAWTAAAQGMFFVPTCAPCSTAATAACLSVVLPIELLHFRGRNEGSANVLEWATASEQNSAHFTVERSADNTAFVPIARVNAAGTSHEAITYSVQDDAPLPGVNYYRLRSTDLDDAEEVSDVVTVHTASSTSLSVYPNPAMDGTGFHLPKGTMLPATLLVRDLTGRVVLSTTLTAQEGHLDLRGLAQGCYLFDVPELGPASAVRFIVER